MTRTEVLRAQNSGVQNERRTKKTDAPHAHAHRRRHPDAKKPARAHLSVTPDDLDETPADRAAALEFLCDVISPEKFFAEVAGCRTCLFSMLYAVRLAMDIGGPLPHDLLLRLEPWLTWQATRRSEVLLELRALAERRNTTRRGEAVAP